MRTPAVTLPRIAPVLAGVLAVLPFLPALGADFLADDWFFVAAYRDPPASFATFAWRAFSALEHVPTNFYRPLPFVTLAAQFQLGMADPVALHAVDLALHGVSAGLLFAIARRLAGGAIGPALLASVLFAWFPRRTEAVAWLSCRPDLLSAMLAAASVWAFEARMRTARPAWLVGSLVAWWLALFSKESVLLLPIVHAGLAWSFKEGSAAYRRARGDLRTFVATLPVYLVLRRAVVGAWVGGYGAEAVAVGPGTMASAARHVAYQFLPPLEFVDATRSAWTSAVLGAVVVALVAVVVLTAWRWRRDVAVRVGMAWLVAGILPVVALPVSLSTSFNDRLLYLPAFGAGLLCCGALCRARGRAATLVVAVLCAALATWSWTLSARWALAGALSDRALDAVARDLARDDAERLYLAAVPDSLGGAYMLRNGVREALAVRGLASAPRVVVLSRYFIDRAAGPMPIEAILDDATTIRLVSVGGGAEILLPSAPDVEDVAYLPSPPADRFGRRQDVRVRLRVPGSAWVVTAGADFKALHR